MLRKWALLFVRTYVEKFASMRPEHGCSGNDFLLCLPVRPFRGFNEAGARMLRKCACSKAHAYDLFPASMRPEHGCSGNELNLSRYIEIIRWLQ